MKFQEVYTTTLEQHFDNLLSEDYFDDHSSVHVSASVRIALFPIHGTNYEELFHNADQALYDVKTGGKDGYKIYSPNQDETLK